MQEEVGVPKKPFVEIMDEGAKIEKTLGALTRLSDRRML